MTDLTVAPYIFSNLRITGHFLKKRKQFFASAKDSSEAESKLSKEEIIRIFEKEILPIVNSLKLGYKFDPNGYTENEFIDVLKELAKQYNTSIPIIDELLEHYEATKNNKYKDYKFISFLYWMSDRLTGLGNSLSRLHNLPPRLNLFSAENHNLISMLEQFRSVNFPALLLTVNDLNIHFYSLIEHIRKLATILHLLKHDPLTGIPDRRSMDQFICQAWNLSVREQKPMTIAYFDLDDFKEVNSRFGHGGGDKILKIFVEVVKNSIRNSDMIARRGGEEFCLVMPNTIVGASEKVLNRILIAFNQLTNSGWLDKQGFPDYKLTCSVSVGQVVPFSLGEPDYRNTYDEMHQTDRKVVDKIDYFIQCLSVALTKKVKKGGKDGYVVLGDLTGCILDETTFCSSIYKELPINRIPEFSLDYSTESLGDFNVDELYKFMGIKPIEREFFHDGETWNYQESEQDSLSNYANSLVSDFVKIRRKLERLKL
ncbi:MAG: GGDEF domain-containing protein [Candidatus Caenarcaniphilales bacterium]|nr:GGDEF domain-containing protein [Candidatus Caenarcaniphilales bacterium]